MRGAQMTLAGAGIFAQSLAQSQNCRNEPMIDANSTEFAIAPAQIVITFVSLAFAADSRPGLQGSSLAAEP